jgi:hypothetical protein
MQPAPELASKHPQKAPGTPGIASSFYCIFTLCFPFCSSLENTADEVERRGI